MSTEPLTLTVKKRYGSLAEMVAKGGSATCGPGECGCGDPISSHLYDATQTDVLPD